MNRIAWIILVVLGLAAGSVSAAQPPENSDGMTFEGEYRLNVTAVMSNTDGPAHLSFSHFGITGTSPYLTVIAASGKEYAPKVHDPLKLVSFARLGELIRVTSDAAGPKVTVQVDNAANKEDLSFEISHTVHGITIGALANDRMRTPIYGSRGEITGYDPNDVFTMSTYMTVPLVEVLPVGDLQLSGAAGFKTPANAPRPGDVQNAAYGVKLSGHLTSNLEAEAVYRKKQPDFGGFENLPDFVLAGETLTKLSGEYTTPHYQGEVAWSHTGDAENDPDRWDDNVVSALVVYRGSKENPVSDEGDYEHQFHIPLPEIDGIGLMAKISHSYGIGRGAFWTGPDEVFTYGGSVTKLDVDAVTPLGDATWTEMSASLVATVDEPFDQTYFRSTVTTRGTLYYQVTEDYGIEPYVWYTSKAGDDPPEDQTTVEFGIGLERKLAANSKLGLQVSTSYDNFDDRGRSNESEVRLWVEGEF